ncbi:hypothetical protein BJY00DRAFT_316707 [Aspergillus carlsbadensis]|nr:hypothetical protein BJY00DRAFT_316707 [Aspergillus carlsbadensis]
MTFVEGTSVTFPTANGERNIGTVKGFENGKYKVEVDGGEVVEVEEADIAEFKIEMMNRGIYETLK